MKRGLTVLFLFAFLFSVTFALADECSDDQLIMRLYGDSTGATNTHVAAWDQNPSDAYGYKVCYDTVFGSSYDGANPHGDSNYNDVVYTYSNVNSHVSTYPDDLFQDAIHYGNLRCAADSTPGDTCANGGEVLIRAASDYNSHVSDRTYTDYPVKICCFNVYWSDMNGNVITNAQVGDTVRMVVPSGVTGGFDVKEDDSVIDDNVRDNIEGFDDGFAYAGTWTITQDDYEGSSSGDDESRQFYFETGGFSSPILAIVDSRSDPNDPNVNDPTVVSFDAPECGSYFNESQEIWINISASDDDDLINGLLKIVNSDGDIVDSFDYGNFGLNQNYIFTNPGEYQIVADSGVTRGMENSVVTSNIMVLDLDASGNYVDGNYTAACLASPISYKDYSEKYVVFDASPTRGVRIVGGVPTVVYPWTLDSFIWDWDFGASDGAYQGANSLGTDLDSIQASNDSKWWSFKLKYPSSGSKTATLTVELPGE